MTPPSVVPAAPAALRPLPSPGMLLGAVRRSLIVTADGTHDTTTEVTWLQGPSLYVDLRVPADPTLPRGGFAGRWSLEGDLARWSLLVDVRPPSGEPDEGRLRWDPDVEGAFLEEGVHAVYTERWHLPEGPVTPAGGLLLSGVSEDPDGDPDGERAAVLVRVGDAFGWACRVGAGAGDVEVSLGRVLAGRWRVERSSRIAGEGADLAPRRDGSTLIAGGHTWRITDSEGDPALPD